MEAADGSEHVQDAADLAPPVDPALAGELGQADGRPVGERVAALSYLAFAVTAVVFLAWYAAMNASG